MSSFPFLFWGIFLVLIEPLAAGSGEQVRLDRNDLLQYRDSQGRIQPVETPADWELRRAGIVKGLHEVMGGMPGDDRRVPMEPRVEEEVDRGTYVQRLITYQSEPESRTPAYLCIPKDVLEGKRRAPAVLCLHGTNMDVGHKIVVEPGSRRGRAYAKELAERGYVTLSPAYPHMANYWPNLGALGYVSGTMKAIWDNSRGMDLLSSLPYVDASRGFAAIGQSLGGHNAIYTAVLDQRIQAVVSSCGFDSYLDYYGGDPARWYFGKGWCQIRYMPRLSNYRGRLEEIPFDFHELLGALAPRPIFINAPLRDGNFQWRSVDRCVAAAKPVYRLLGDEKSVIVRHPDCGHEFPDEIRYEAFRFIDSVLRGE